MYGSKYDSASCAQTSEDRPAAVKARIARPRDRPPETACAVHEQHVIQPVDRLETHDARRIAVLLENHGSGERGFETVRRVMLHHAAE